MMNVCVREICQEVIKKISLKFEKLILFGSGDSSLSEKERGYIVYTNRIMFCLVFFQLLLVCATIIFSKNILLITTEILIPFATLFGQALKWLGKIYLSTSFLLIISVMAIITMDKIYFESNHEEGGFFLYNFLVIFVICMTLRYSNYSFWKKVLFYVYPLLGFIFCFASFPLNRSISTIYQLHIHSMFFINVLFVFCILTVLLISQIALNNALTRKIRNKQKKIVRIIQKNDLYAMNAVIVAEEKEKRRFSEELHDSVGQLLATTISNMDLLTIEETSNKLTQETVSNCVHLLKMAMSEVRSISHNLMPAVLMDLGLCDAINEVCEKARLRNGIKIMFCSERDIKYEFQPHYEMSLHLYRIVQESVSNIVKHSGATAASITFISHDEKYMLSITDNGRGFQESVKKGNGLSNMKKRAMAIGAELEVESELNHGTTITVFISNKNKLSKEYGRTHEYA